MRLRRLEIAVLAITLAFAFFMGGFFTGRSTGSVNIATAQSIGIQSTQTPSENTTPNRIAEQQTPAPGAQTSAPSDVQVSPQPTAGNNSSSGTGAPRETDGKININTASHGELTDLPGIGDVIAARIIDYRTQNGNFTHIEDIKNVSGIGERKFDAMKNLISVG